MAYQPIRRDGGPPGRVSGETDMARSAVVGSCAGTVHGFAYRWQSLVSVAANVVARPSEFVIALSRGCPFGNDSFTSLLLVQPLHDELARERLISLVTLLGKRAQSLNRALIETH